MNAPDPYLSIPLDGVQLIEASAGTGKTFTLATLVTRLVVEQRCRIGQILAVTYTEAATQELRKRIRLRLQLALRVFDSPAVEGEEHEVTLTRNVINAYLAQGSEAPAALRQRLQQAVLDTDLAAVFTIHGFCARVLREHALESGAGFDGSDLLGNDSDLRARLAADLWRAWAVDAATATDVLALWNTHEALGDDLHDLLSPIELVPPAASLPPDPLPQVEAAGHALAENFREHGAKFLEDVRAALANKVLNGSRYKLDWIEPLWQQWAAWCVAGEFSQPPDERIARFVAATLQSNANQGKADQVPASPLCRWIPPYLAELQTRANYLVQRRANLLHSLRDDARVRMARLKREQRVQTFDDLIDGVANALAGDQADALARSLREQYQVALVDEFQDTDARQWNIFNRVFGAGSDRPALFLIGDPKQAIYGFRGGDVHAYLDAAASATHAPELLQNFRSRPCVIAALNALYLQAGDTAFVEEGIHFHAAEAGGKCRDTDFLLDGQPAPALTLWQAPATGRFNASGKKPTCWSAGESRALATNACVAAIHAVLTKARDGYACIDGRRIQPGDIAVLVRTHSEATQIQRALANVGIPAVSAGKQSLFATDEAHEVHALLLALLHGGDDGRLRMALATVLVGVDALGIDALENDNQAHRQWQQTLMEWRARWQRGGALALIGELCAQSGARLLGLLDGERRLSNYLQLAEALQEAQVREMGLHGLVTWLALHIAEADTNDERQLLRLESDAKRVQIVTLHKSKGLEYPLVFLPFAGIGGGGKSPSRSSVVRVGTQRQLHWNLALPSVDWDDVKQRRKNAQDAEDTRLLYVGVTRAQHALWLAAGPLYASEGVALARLLNDPSALAANADIVLETAVPPPHLPRLSLDAESSVAPARRASQEVHSDWWVHSFSQLTKPEASSDRRSSATVPAHSGNDESAPAPAETETGTEAAAFDPRFAGARFGVALHAAFEHADFNAWQGWQPGQPAPDDQTGVIENALREQGYIDADVAAGVPLCTHLLGHTLTATLPEGVRLCELPNSAHRAEIEFQFALRPTAVDALLQLLHAYGVVRERDRFGSRRQLDGLMAGFIDLTYCHDGKWYVLDYKSNRLPSYEAAAMQQAMAHSEYDLQALIYTLALHRWLRFKLGERYHYARDFGGIRYVFCRGVDATHATAHGIHAQRFEPELIEQLDALFGHTAEGVAA